MKVVSYGTISKRGFQRKKDETSFRQHMKDLHKSNVQFTPMVLVEGIPGESKARWKKLNEYNKLIKKEEKR